jgi:hypothetical protein
MLTHFYHQFDYFIALMLTVFIIGSLTINHTSKAKTVVGIGTSHSASLENNVISETNAKDSYISMLQKFNDDEIA